MAIDIWNYVPSQTLPAITFTFPLVTGLMVFLKTPVDSIISPKTDLHDWVVRALTLLFDLTGVLLVMWLLGVKGDAKSSVWTLIATAIAWMASTGLYHLSRGPVPVTPTAKAINALHQSSPVVPPMNPPTGLTP